MEAKAVLKYTRISPRKVEIVLDLIRNKPVDLAMAILKHTPKAACEDLEKLLKSAIANAENNFNMDRNNLYVSECYVCPGPMLKRIRPRAQGRALQNFEENLSRHTRCEGEGISEGGHIIWVRKLIPTAYAWASSKTGIPAGSQRDDDFGDTLVEDYNLRKTLKKQLYARRCSED